MENQKKIDKIKLTQYSRGAGCGCKISPQVLEEILSPQFAFPDSKLLVGNSSKDDAAVYDLGDGNALISTTDFFMPIVDDAFDFGQIAAANAISDVYAMGGKPVMAIALLGWPIDKLPSSLAKEVMNGARKICTKAGIALAGGHSIDSAEPFFGLSVNGLIPIKNLKKNSTAQEGDQLFLTKSLGVGILSTAQKRDVLKEEDLTSLISQLTSLNSVGEDLGKVEGVSAMTDVTGFGLAGHVIEMAEGSGLSVQINYSRLCIPENVKEYLSKRIVPDATYRNWNNCNKKIDFGKGVNVMEAFSILPDPQTNGGLLIAVNPNSVNVVQQILKSNGMENFLQPIGNFIAKKEKTVYVLE
ncbi:MAG: selenide, water dikinase SelD [Ginsengibacter sp.]